MYKNYILKRKKYPNEKDKIIFINGKIKLYKIIIISSITFLYNSDTYVDESKNSYITLKIGSGNNKIYNSYKSNKVYINYIDKKKLGLFINLMNQKILLNYYGKMIYHVANKCFINVIK